ncbi:unnamed protein product [Vitrella brassicaformis CCMP3155]|uniref:Nitroreductase domain-containing protein n=2 Tax=Vitrella brassicaformis TaxID=1169539 RepID=A0A0G4EUD4_VITBC|nr:unnamed protein product [Vitrella brassicaformis CCMP3155]|mmetsp:Transcript_36942/g.105799  ORF Transcript_36942/g.105799 Transcript_36942/m.105799 type:complete len:259 (+) Transcript_36942:50-826(+)|eukprot:CEM01700.1 unnamed protein product [Vitrella brassicaformis CCMP3155]
MESVAEGSILTVGTSLVTLVAVCCLSVVFLQLRRKQQHQPADETRSSNSGDDVQPVLACIQNRRSVFPRHYVNEAVSAQQMERLLEAAMCAPFHGPVPPWRFVVLGRKGMLELQHLTLAYYDQHWRGVGIAETEEQYGQWRQVREREVDGRWGSVSFMVAIVMRRQAGSKRMPEWEEAAATACAVQNMHLQASTERDLGCYWSSWFSSFRDSPEMAQFLEMQPEDKCFGFFIVAKCLEEATGKKRRKREMQSHVEWRE